MLPRTDHVSRAQLEVVGSARDAHHLLRTLGGTALRGWQSRSHLKRATGHHDPWHTNSGALSSRVRGPWARAHTLLLGTFLRNHLWAAQSPVENHTVAKPVAQWQCGPVGLGLALGLVKPGRLQSEPPMTCE